jgi:hypothetical protein
VPVNKLESFTEQQLHLLNNGFRIQSSILWSIWFVKQWLRILNT